MVESPPPNDPLVAHLSGKRRWARVAAASMVALDGEHAAYRARVLDLSRGGLLAAIEDPTFYADAAEDGLTLVHARFPDGVVVRFPNDALVRRTQIVRITPHGDEAIALGCRFDQELTDAEAVRVGVAAAESGHPEATAATLTHEPRPRHPISLVLFARETYVTGPYALGRVVAIGERAVDARIDGSRDTVLMDLAGDAVRAALVRGTERLWEGDLRVVACEEEGDAKAGHTGLRLRLMAEEAWGREVSKHVRAASGA